MPTSLRAGEPINPDLYSIERFCDFVETLELCREYAISDNSVRIRFALILLDNLAELLMLHKCQNLFENERSRFPGRLRKEAVKDFPGKVRFLRSNGNFISAHDAIILRISHSFRNAAFHRDEHNASANGAIARALFDTVCRIFRMSYESGGITGGWSADLSSLGRYGYSKPYLEFAEASQRVSLELADGTEFSLETLRPILVNDLLSRHQRVVAAIRLDLPLDELILDVILKSEEFDDDSASTKRQEAEPGFSEGHTPAREEHFRLEQDYTARVRSDFDTFRPTTNWRRITLLSHSITRLYNANSTSVLLDRYRQLNEFLSKGERYLYGAIRKNDTAAEFASDLARGK